MTGLYAPTVTRLRPAIRTDRYGDTQPDWEQPPTRTDLVDVNLDRTEAIYDKETGRQLATPGIRMVCNGHVDLHEWDRIEALGQLWSLEGPPLHLLNPHSGDAKTEVQLVRTEG